jgi:excisionase family DNA binding protein
MKTTQDMSPLLVGVADAARLLGVSRRTVQNMICSKRLIFKKIGKRTLVPYSALTQIAARGTATKPSDNGDAL